MSTCTACVYEREHSIVFDRSKTAPDWEAATGIGRSAVLRHLKHAPVVTVTPTEPVAATYKFERGADDFSGNSPASETPQTVDDVEAFVRAKGMAPADWDLQWRFSEWEQSSKLGGTKTLHAFRVSGKRKVGSGKDATITEADILEAQTRIRSYALPRRIPGTGLGAPIAAVLNLADMQLMKSEGNGLAGSMQRLTDGLENFQSWVGRQRAGGRNIDEVVIVNNGDPYEGIAGNYATQLHTVEGGLRAQMNAVLDVWELYARELYPQFDKGQFVSVLCNHGELGRLGGNKNQTSDSDNGGALLAESLQRILRGRPDFDHVRFTIPHDEMNVYSDVAGVPVGFNHGHKIPGNDASGFEKWLSSQVRGSEDVWRTRVWITAHRHNFQAFDLGSAMVFQCPSCDGGSKWLRDMTGRFSRSGTLAMLIGEHDPMGWSDPVFL